MWWVTIIGDDKQLEYSRLPQSTHTHSNWTIFLSAVPIQSHRITQPATLFYSFPSLKRIVPTHRNLSLTPSEMFDQLHHNMHFSRFPQQQESLIIRRDQDMPEFLEPQCQNQANQILSSVFHTLVHSSFSVSLGHIFHQPAEQVIPHLPPLLFSEVLEVCSRYLVIQTPTKLYLSNQTIGISKTTTSTASKCWFWTLCQKEDQIPPVLPCSGHKQHSTWMLPNFLGHFGYVLSMGTVTQSKLWSTLSNPVFKGLKC